MTSPKNEIFTKEKAEFLFEQFSKLLDQTISDRKSIETKANFISGIIGVIVAWNLKMAFDELKFDFATCFQLTWSLLLIILMVILVFKCLLPSEYQAPGLLPDETQGLANNLLKSEYPLLVMGVGKSFKKRIDDNIKANEKRSHLVKWIAFSAVISPLIAVVLVVIF